MRICEIISFVLLVSITSYCVPHVFEPMDEHRYSSPDQSLDAVVRYYAYGGAIGGSYTTIEVVQKGQSAHKRRLWLQLFTGAQAAVRGKLRRPPHYKDSLDAESSSHPVPVWIGNTKVLVKYCDYFEYYRNYEKINIDSDRNWIYIEIEDMCEHKKSW